MYKRGDVYLVQEPSGQGSEIKKTRPWVIVGANPINKARRTVVSIPLSTQAGEIKGLSIKTLLNNTTAYAVIDQIRALDKSRFVRYEGTLTKFEIELIDEGLKNVLSL